MIASIKNPRGVSPEMHVPIDRAGRTGVGIGERGLSRENDIRSDSDTIASVLPQAGRI